MRRDRQGGFTLLELLVALAVMAGMMMITWGTTQNTVRAKRDTERLQDRYRAVRVALNRIVRDLSMAYLSTNEDRTVQEPRTYFIGEGSSDLDSLRFSTLSHTPLYADANESEQTAVAYYAAPDRQDRTIKNLVRRELRRPGIDKWDSMPGEAQLVFPDIERFEVEYWDTQKSAWQDEWKDLGTGAAPRVPDRVRITLTYLDARDKEQSYTTEARIHLQETLSFYAQ